MSEFDQYAEGYSNLLDDPVRNRFARGEKFFIHQKCRELLRQLGTTPSDRPLKLLDAGCGRGTAMAFMRPHAQVIGADVSFGMLHSAVKQAPVVMQEPFDLPFADNTFDAAYAFCVYHHIEDRHHVRHLRELTRVVKPGGRVLIFEHNPYNPVTKRIFERAPIDQGCHMIAPPRLRMLFEEAGLEAIEQEYLLFLPEVLWNWIGALERGLSWLPLGGQYVVSGRKREVAA